MGEESCGAGGMPFEDRGALWSHRISPWTKSAAVSGQMIRYVAPCHGALPLTAGFGSRGR